MIIIYSTYFDIKVFLFSFCSDLRRPIFQFGVPNENKWSRNERYQWSSSNNKRMMNAFGAHGARTMSGLWTVISNLRSIEHKWTQSKGTVWAQWAHGKMGKWTFQGPSILCSVNLNQGNTNVYNTLAIILSYAIHF